MTEIVHNAVLVQVASFVYDATLPAHPPMPDVDAFRESMPEELRPLLVGPVPNIINGGAWFVFGPDGSKEGWSESDLAELWRRRFIELFSFVYEDRSSPYDVVYVRWGGDKRSAGKGVTILCADDFIRDQTGEVI